MDLINNSQREQVYYALLPSSILSTLGCIFIITIYLSFNSLHQFAFKMIFILSIFDLCSSLVFLFPTYNSSSDDSLCISQAILMNFFASIAVHWTAFIALSLYEVVIKNTVVLEKHLKTILCCLICVNFIFTLVPILTGSYGRTTGWCWIVFSNDWSDSALLERCFLFFVPLWIVIGLNLVLYSVMIKKSNKKIEDESVVRSLKKKLKFYPLILIVCYLPYTVKVTMEIFALGVVKDYEVGLTALAGVCRSIIGLMNAVTYGRTKQVKGLIWKKLMGRKDTLDHLAEKIKSSYFNGEILKPVQGSQYTVFFGSASISD